MAVTVYSEAAAIICIASSFCTAALFAYSLARMLRNQQLAYGGDAIAAKRLILPCFKPLFRAFVGIFFALGCLQIVLLVILNAYDMKFELFAVVQFYGLCLLMLYCISPVLLQQSSISISAFWRTGYILGPYFLLCLLIWIVDRATRWRDPAASNAVAVVFWVVTFFPPVIFCAGIVTKRIRSRIQIQSLSNRGSVDYLAVYSVLYAILNVAVFATHKTNTSRTSTLFVAALQIYAVLVFVVSLFFPFAFYRSLLADTKFWRGIGRHNQGGIRFSESIQRGDLEAPTIELNVLTGDFQDMITNIGEQLVIDFAFLRIDKKLGDGATAEVYRGTYRNLTLAVKISTPPEVTPEVISVFATEASVSSSLSQCPQILQFHGICIRPPQIAMVMELCSRGDLRASLLKHATQWSAERKLMACLDAAKALAYVHAKCYIHRDVKAANFFVTEGFEVRLGDFGETCVQQDFETTTKENRMGILGTVAFMAPELIAAKIHYTEAVDMYAYAVMMWEIWTGGGEPFGDVSTFKTYELVGKGERPDVSRFKTDPSMAAITGAAPATGPLPIPPGVLELMQASWAQDPAERLKASDVVTKLQEIIPELYEQGGNKPAAEAFVAAQQAALAAAASEQALSSRSSTMGSSIGGGMDLGAFTRSGRESLSSMIKDTMSSIRGRDSGSATPSNAESAAAGAGDATAGEGGIEASTVSNPMQQQQGSTSI